ncbi:hypothetical protein HanHA300_Chr01g0011851 [Helianthus annuus]|nr:hypothetical protein HanHA300_Chr01g0011851 [Helianthus annuus]
MNKADELILCIPFDAACKLWGVDKAPTDVMIHTDDGRIFNVWLSESKGIFFLFPRMVQCNLTFGTIRRMFGSI